jgi:hypothetical protein
MSAEDDGPLSDHDRIGRLEDQVRRLWSAQSLVSDQVAEYEAKRAEMEKQQDAAIASGLEKAISALIERKRRDAADGLLSWIASTLWAWIKSAALIGFAIIIVGKTFGWGPIVIFLERWIVSIKGP